MCYRLRERSQFVPYVVHDGRLQIEGGESRPIVGEQMSEIRLVLAAEEYALTGQRSANLDLVIVVVLSVPLKSRNGDDVLLEAQGRKQCADAAMADHDVGLHQKLIEFLCGTVGELARVRADVAATAGLDDELVAAEHAGCVCAVHGGQEPVERHTVRADSHQNHSSV